MIYFSIHLSKWTLNIRIFIVTVRVNNVGKLQKVWFCSWLLFYLITMMAHTLPKMYLFNLELKIPHMKEYSDPGKEFHFLVVLTYVQTKIFMRKIEYPPDTVDATLFYLSSCPMVKASILWFNQFVNHKKTHKSTPAILKIKA